MGYAVKVFEAACAGSPVRPATVNLNADRKRFWLGKLQSVNDKVCNDSEPMSLNHFAKEEI